MPSNQRISALIITYNEEKNIGFVLDSLNFVDEIIIVDSYSTDATLSIVAQYHNVKLIQNKFENFAQQRNFALSLTRNNWVLFLDADERLTRKLTIEILKKIQNNPEVVAYYFKRQFLFKNKKLRFSGWQTDKIIRLFNKEKASYNIDKIVHEKLILKGKVETLHHKLLHHSYSDYKSYKEKMIFYAKLKAKEEVLKKTNPTFFHFFLRPTYQFFYQFIIRSGFLDGKKGLIICYLNALSVAVRFQELKKTQAKN